MLAVKRHFFERLIIYSKCVRHPARAYYLLHGVRAYTKVPYNPPIRRTTLHGAQYIGSKRGHRQGISICNPMWEGGATNGGIVGNFCIYPNTMQEVINISLRFSELNVDQFVLAVANVAQGPLFRVFSPHSANVKHGKRQKMSISRDHGCSVLAILKRLYMPARCQNRRHHQATLPVALSVVGSSCCH
jgi:hypothetical protein